MVPRRPFICKYCDLPSHCFDRLKRHEARHRRGVSRDFTNCRPIHHKGLKVKARKLLHVLDYNIYQCKECGIYFEEDKKHHTTSTKPVTFFQHEFCSKCSTEGSECIPFTRPSIDKNKYVQCEHCKRYFSQQCYLAKHIEAQHRVKKPCNDAERSYPCKLCMESFADSTQLAVHYTTHAVYQCTHCQVFFTNRFDLERHLPLCTANVSHKAALEKTYLYQCGICQKRYIQKSDLKKHSVSVHRLISYECQFCQEHFDKFRDFHTHMETHKEESTDKDEKVDQCEHCLQYFSQAAIESHSKSCSRKTTSGYQCNLCQLRFTSKLDIGKHVYSAHKMKPFRCDKCHEYFAQKDTFEAHVKICMENHSGKPSPEKSYECKICQKRFTRKFDLKKHSITAHKVKLSYKCQYCDQCYEKFRDLVAHISTHKKEETNIDREKPYQCKCCKKNFKFQKTLFKHYKSHIKKKHFRCNFCRKSFLTANGYKTHMVKNARKSNLGPYQCSFCQSQFEHECTLIQHEGTHKNRLQCPECKKYFQGKSRLKVHIRSHTNEKPYRCDYCYKCFTTLGHLKMHIRIHTGEKPYVCEYCGKGFPRNFQLKSHVRSHTKEKPYPCEHCGRCFSTRSQLTSHIRTHTKEKPYQCDECGKCFSRSSNLIKHRETHRRKKRKNLSSSV